jgi:endonuclease YncB( thermonuclease family)
MLGSLALADGRILCAAVRALIVLSVLVTASANAEEFRGEVVRVVDGDSLLVKFHGQQVRVRLKEIDAPELKQPFGKDARQSLAQICAKKVARVSWTELDRNGRTLGRVWCGEIDANAEQVRRGMAWVFDRYVTDQMLYRLQDASRGDRLGLWSDPAPIAPWKWRQDKGTLEYRARKLQQAPQ